ncbi:MAG: DUF362 domain-containing protein, partial [Tepidisphaerales bacterium]
MNHRIECSRSSTAVKVATVPEPISGSCLRLGGFTRRQFLRGSAAAAATVVLPRAALAGEPAPISAAGAKVSIVACKGYGPEVLAAMRQAFGLIGGIGSLVKDKTVTVKVNLTGTDFRRVFARPVGESVMTHFSTAAALCGLLFDAGARRVRFVESTQSRLVLEQSLGEAGWDVNALLALGKVEFENTRNLGLAKKYSEMKVPGGGLLFSSFQFNHAYEETDVMVSLCKLKQHATAGITLSMKNLFGITPNSIYGDEAGSELATAGRGLLHTTGWQSDPAIGRYQLPGYKLKRAEEPADPGILVQRIVTDICGARPIHLALIDGITSMSGGEGPWIGKVAYTKPGVFIAGLEPVATDAVGAAVMGIANPRAPRWTV